MIEIFFYLRRGREEEFGIFGSGDQTEKFGKKLYSSYTHDLGRKFGTTLIGKEDGEMCSGNM